MAAKRLLPAPCTSVWRARRSIPHLIYINRETPMIKITRFFYINLLVIPLFVLAYFVGALQTLLMAYAVVTVHELFHLFAALLLKVRVGSIIVMPFGMTLRLQGNIIKNPAKEILIALAGPFANLVMLGVGAFLKHTYIWAEQSMFLYQYLNIITLCVNLLPVLPLDGGRVVKAVLTWQLGYINGLSIMKKLSRVVIAAVFVLGVGLIVLTRFNISLVMVGAFLAFNMVEEKRNNDFIIMKELLYSKEKLMKSGVMVSRSISAMEHVSAHRILKMLSYHNFYMIHVVDENLELVKILTESELVEAVLHQGYHIRIGDIRGSTGVRRTG